MKHSYRPLRSLAFRLVMLSVVLLLLTVFIVTTVVLYKKFSAIEYDLAFEHMKRIQQAFLNVQDALEVKSADWAIWDDTYKYVVDLNPEYVSSNLTVPSFSNLQINFVLLFDKDNHLVHKTSLDWRAKREEMFPEDLLEMFDPASPFLQFDSIDSVRSGVVMSFAGPIIIVARPILSSQAQGPSHGVLVFGKILDQVQLKKMSLALQLDLSMSPWTEGEGKGITVHVLGKDKMLGRCLIYDLKGKPAFVLSAKIPRNILRQAFYSAGWLFILLVFVGILFFFIIYFFIDRKFLRRLESLTQQTEVVAKDGSGKLTLKLEGNDELSQLVSLINEVVMELRLKREETSIVNSALSENMEVLNKQKEDLEKVNLELDSFVYTASHDLRAPLRGIASFATFLYDDYKDKLDEDGREYINEIRKGADRLSRLIDDLLTLSRISRINNPFERVDVSLLVKNIVERIEFDVESAQVDLRIQENMPVIQCDRIKLGEVFLNLINNAIKFSSKNRNKPPKVEVGYQEDADSYAFYVKDNGIGIAPEYHKQVFEMFKRLHTQDEFEGTGAGLSIVKRVIDDHKGKVWIVSDVGQGAAFWFSIPKDLT